MDYKQKYSRIQNLQIQSPNQILHPIINSVQNFVKRLSRLHSRLITFSAVELNKEEHLLCL